MLEITRTVPLRIYFLPVVGLLISLFVTEHRAGDRWDIILGNLILLSFSTLITTSAFFLDALLKNFQPLCLLFAFYFCNFTRGQNFESRSPNSGSYPSLVQSLDETIISILCRRRRNFFYLGYHAVFVFWRDYYDWRINLLNSKVAIVNIEMRRCRLALYQPKALISGSNICYIFYFDFQILRRE